MLVYVDDIILIGTHPSLIATVIVKLQLEFPLKDLGPLHYFLGIQMTRHNHNIHLCQQKYISKLLAKAHMDEAKHAKTPCSSISKLSRHDGELLPNPTSYR
jgi:hypothetical protein